jgi:hypothetical protein
MLLNRKIWLNRSLIATAGAGLLVVGALAGCSGKEAGEGGEAGATQAQGGEGGEGGEAGQGGEGGEGGEAGAGTGDYPGGDFSNALSKVMMGEGGEGGIGLTKGDRTVSIPQLKDAQITQVVSGNTLRTEHHFSYYFDAAGSAEGWDTEYNKVDASQCKKEDLENGECWTSKQVQLPSSKWSVAGDKLCLDPAVPAITGSGDCAEVYLILNKVGLYGADGKLVGKGSDLYAGKQLGEKASR